jgi:transcriptional regulator with XRE-family HTH domain
MDFPEILKTLRKEKGLTQAQLAKSLNLSKETIFRYETGKREPNFEAMSKLEKFFGVSIGYLKGETDNNYQDTKEEFLETISYLITHFERLNKFLNKFPQEEQLEAFSFLEIAVDLLINENINHEEMFSYLDVLNGFIMELHRLVQILNQSTKNKIKIDIKRIREKYTEALSNSLSELSEIYGIEEM